MSRSLLCPSITDPLAQGSSTGGPQTGCGPSKAFQRTELGTENVCNKGEYCIVVCKSLNAQSHITYFVDFQSEIKSTHPPQWTNLHSQSVTPSANAANAANINI